MANTKKPAEELVIKNPQFNASNQLTAFDGIKLVNNKADRSDPETMRLIKALQDWPRIPGCGDGGKSSPRIKVGDTEYSLSNKFFTVQEAENYKNYRDEHPSTGGGSGRKSNAIGDRATFDMLTQMIEKYSAKKDPQYKEVVGDLIAQRLLYLDALSADELREIIKSGKLY